MSSMVLVVMLPSGELLGSLIRVPIRKRDEKTGRR